jgi:dynein heavy chain, axonemal
VETFRRWTGNLELVVNINNEVLQELLPVEKPLVRPYLDKFDKAVAAGVGALSWKSDGAAIEEFIAACTEQVSTSHFPSVQIRIQWINLGTWIWDISVNFVRE